jgi:16S rRNA G966 N2-methylase RsmD
VQEFENKLEEELFVYDSNLARRHLTKFQRIEIALKKKPLLAKLAERHMKAGITLSRKQERVHVDEKLAKDAKVAKDTLYKVEKVLEAAVKNPNRKLNVDYDRRIEHSAYPTYTKVVEDARQGKLSIAQAYSIIDRDQRVEQKHAEIAEASKALNMPDRITLINADSTKEIPQQQIPDNSVDLIITDPPYPKEHLWIFEELAKFAVKKLKEGGSLVFYYNRYYEPEIHAMFSNYIAKGGGLTYWWSLVVQHGNGSGTRVHNRGVIPMLKPMLWFVKGDRKAGVKDVRDFIQSTRQTNSKMIHQWAQSRVEAEYIIESITVSKDALVVDPFLGSGEFAIAAFKTGRYFIGVEKDKQTFENAQNYTKNETAGLSLC